MDRMTSLIPGHNPPHVTIAACTSSGAKYTFSLGPARTTHCGVNVQLDVFSYEDEEEDTPSSASVGNSHVESGDNDVANANECKTTRSPGSTKNFTFDFLSLRKYLLVVVLLCLGKHVFECGAQKEVCNGFKGFSPLYMFIR
jgi:hypothetical protein